MIKLDITSSKTISQEDSKKITIVISVSYIKIQESYTH